MLWRKQLSMLWQKMLDMPSLSTETLLDDVETNEADNFDIELAKKVLDTYRGMLTLNNVKLQQVINNSWGISGFKGGTGKSTFAIILALAIAQKYNCPVTLIDTDFLAKTSQQFYGMVADSQEVYRAKFGPRKTPITLFTLLTNKALDSRITVLQQEYIACLKRSGSEANPLRYKSLEAMLAQLKNKRDALVLQAKKNLKIADDSTEHLHYCRDLLLPKGALGQLFADSPDRTIYLWDLPANSSRSMYDLNPLLVKNIILSTAEITSIQSAYGGSKIQSEQKILMNRPGEFHYVINQAPPGQGSKAGHTIVDLLNKKTSKPGFNFLNYAGNISYHEELCRYRSFYHKINNLKGEYPYPDLSPKLLAELDPLIDLILQRNALAAERSKAERERTNRLIRKYDRKFD
ncbi:hypothetical protein NO2_0078 [Candidatus Termititenax persephonae]|uniref:CobQ/CobB/MinD/ParA nucleotide binding domain-containing protein n=1 Tax=Candidatus Termititenax persephonae TaxID=2218525 RepID=A0A388TEE3_9BACT|nr:hypothetical protein NO2_0078 [Candidatus Termititenax persephonae]